MHNLTIIKNIIYESLNYSLYSLRLNGSQLKFVASPT